MSRTDKALASSVVEKAVSTGTTISTVESCTGGLLGGAITSVPGSSAAYLGGLITYANEAKMKLAKVSKASLESFGAVSSEVACEMAKGCREELESDIAISITGIAGPDGGDAKKPVGTVWFGIATKGETKAILQTFDSRERDEVRCLAVRFALEQIMILLSEGMS